MTREIPLSRGMVALVDDEDYAAVVAAGPWCVRPNRRTTYAHRTVRKPGTPKTTQMLHTFLTCWPLVDHINGDGLDNRRANLRQATQAQNMANKRRPLHNTSGFKGVTFHHRGPQWRARIADGPKRIHLGLYPTPEAAARAYDAAARELFGEFARPNFPLNSMERSS